MALLREYTSGFTMTGRNIGFTQEARREHEQFYGSAPMWARVMRRPIVWHHWVRRWMHGAYRQEPFTYSIFTKSEPERRTDFRVHHPDFRWRGCGYISEAAPATVPVPRVSGAMATP
jgi:hypothetical protein